MLQPDTRRHQKEREELARNQKDKISAYEMETVLEEEKRIFIEVSFARCKTFWHIVSI
jgi:hypothetical protein